MPADDLAVGRFVTEVYDVGAEFDSEEALTLYRKYMYRVGNGMCRWTYSLSEDWRRPLVKI